ncbi:MAG: AMP-binding protein [Ichthyobacteriaceae bacterium]|nr:AMP-binding protein [Ichthyobacteriaceae bacterium]
MILLDFSAPINSNINLLKQYSEPWIIDILDFLIEWNNTLNYIEVYTSGSTGSPKKIELEKIRVINSAKNTINYFGLNKNNNALLALSTNYIAGKLMIIRSIESKMKLHCIKPTSTPLLNNNLTFSFVAMTPMQVSASINQLNKGRVQNLIIGGGAINTLLLKEINKLPNNIFATYGMTETITHVALKKLNNIPNNTPNNTPTNLYTALPNITFSVNNNNCLIINAPYLNNNLITTNDVVKLNNMYSFEWLGRFDNIINSGGIKINPETVELKLDKFITERFFITSVNDILFGEKVVLIIESDNINYTIKNISTELSKYQIPKLILYTNKFIETKNGKINRSETLKNCITTLP